MVGCSGCRGRAPRLRARHRAGHRHADRPGGDRRGPDRTAVRGIRRDGHARATSAGIRTPTSTTARAAVRCSTWGPTTSPRSSTCSARCARSSARRAGRAPNASSPPGPRAGERIPVEVDTHVTGVLEHEGGALSTLTTSFDGTATTAAPIEVHGERGTLAVPDPNRFDGDVRLAALDGAPGWQGLEPSAGYADSGRGVGLLDFVRAEPGAPGASGGGCRAAQPRDHDGPARLGRVRSPGGAHDLGRAAGAAAAGRRSGLAGMTGGAPAGGVRRGTEDHWVFTLSSSRSRCRMPRTGGQCTHE